ncbi:MAG: hypothetical protein K6F51_07860 [Acetatifactor sp.]|nr:hypothetical protein [Acetatifactor sp.]
MKEFSGFWHREQECSGECLAQSDGVLAGGKARENIPWNASPEAWGLQGRQWGMKMIENFD